MFAVIETGGKQYIVREGQTLSIEKIDAQAGDAVNFDKVLLVAEEDGSKVNVGTPYLSGASVPATVTAQSRDKKIRVTKYKNKIRYKRVIGHRQHKTAVTIGKIK